jgi:aminoglycoside phosphotransferase family enzyme
LGVLKKRFSSLPKPFLQHIPDENFRQTEAFVGSTLSRPGFEAIRLYTENFYNRNAKAL